MSGEPITITVQDVRDYLTTVYVNPHFMGNQLSDILIPAFAKTTDTNVFYYTENRGALALKYAIGGSSAYRPHISFYRDGAHFNRIVSTNPQRVHPGEKESAEEAQRVFNYFVENERTLNMSDLNQLVPEVCKFDMKIMLQTQRITLNSNRQNASPFDNRTDENNLRSMMNEGLSDYELQSIGYIHDQIKWVREHREDADQARALPSNRQTICPFDSKTDENNLRDMMNDRLRDYELQAIGYTPHQIKWVREHR